MPHRRFIGDKLVMTCKRDPKRPGYFLVKLRTSAPLRWWQRLLFFHRARTTTEWVSLSQTQYTQSVCFEQADTPPLKD